MAKKQTILEDNFEQELKDNGIEIIEEEEQPDGIGALFTPRLTAPSSTDKNWIHYTKKGYNYCIKINATTGSCLPNCVGYAWGRWRELLGKKPKLSRSNAENWWGTKDGYKRGQTPKLGAVACWRKGKAGVASDGAGHVAIVEKIDKDGTVTFSNSNYSGTRFFLVKLKKPYKIGTGLTFQGFIYPPVEFAQKAKETVSKFTLTGVNYPKTIKKGQYFTIKGMIKSALTMKRIQVCIVNAKTNKLACNYDNKNLKAKSFNVNNADSKMTFRKLAKGTYYYKIIATDTKGTKTLLNKKFTVK